VLLLVDEPDYPGSASSAAPEPEVSALSVERKARPVTEKAELRAEIDVSGYGLRRCDGERCGDDKQLHFG
jgi:hypothetical protein